MRALIFVNGIITEYDWLNALIRDDDYLICADGGANHCIACGRTPHMVVGDMDSLTTETVTWLAAQDVVMERHPAAKNATDLELAIDAALQRITAQPSITEIFLLGVLGGRLDQMLANLLLLTHRNWPVPVRIVDRQESAQLVQSGETATIYGHSGDIFSAIPLTPTVSGITYTGLLYPLKDFTLHMGSTRGISNELAENEATATVGEGKLLIIHRWRED